MNEIKKKQKNINAMINKEILDSIILEKIIVQKRFEKEQELKTVHSNLDGVLSVDNNLDDFKFELPKIIIINEDDYKNNLALADADIDFHIISSGPAPSYSDEVQVMGVVPHPYSDKIQVTGVSQPYIINDVEFEDLETIKYASNDDVDVSSSMDKMEYDDVMITHVTPLHPGKRLERLQKIKNIKNEIDNEISLIVDSIIVGDDDDDVVITGQTPLHPKKRLERPQKMKDI